MTFYRTFSTKQPCPKLGLVRRFLRDHGTALALAAHRLGGPAASGRVFLLCEAVRHTRRLTRAQSSQLVDFHKLLTLEHVSDPDRIECGLFAQIILLLNSSMSAVCCPKSSGPCCGRSLRMNPQVTFFAKPPRNCRKSREPPEPTHTGVGCLEGAAILGAPMNDN